MRVYGGVPMIVAFLYQLAVAAGFIAGAFVLLLALGLGWAVWLGGISRSRDQRDDDRSP